MVRIVIIFLMLFTLGHSSNAEAQFAASRRAQHIAILRAVVNYKIDDEEHIRDIEALRQNERFNRRLERMLSRLQNTRTKNSTNRRILQILEDAGRDIDNLLR